MKETQYLEVGDRVVAPDACCMIAGACTVRELSPRGTGPIEVYELVITLEDDDKMWEQVVAPLMYEWEVAS